jgi:hypothetical protein
MRKKEELLDGSGWLAADEPPDDLVSRRLGKEPGNIGDERVRGVASKGHERQPASERGQGGGNVIQTMSQVAVLQRSGPSLPSDETSAHAPAGWSKKSQISDKNRGVCLLV